METREGASIKCDLITTMLREEIERKLLRSVDFSKSMKEIDAVVDQMVRRFFKELNMIRMLYGQYYEDLEEKQLIIQKRNCLIHLSDLQLEQSALKILKRSKSITKVDDLLSEKIDEYDRNVEKIRQYYDPLIESEED